jgi:hypothetical protein
MLVMPCNGWETPLEIRYTFWDGVGVGVCFHCTFLGSCRDNKSCQFA